jgi:hypothetical protein
MKKGNCFGIVFALLLFGACLTGPTSTARAAGLSAGCSQVNNLSHTLLHSNPSNWWVIDQFYAGEKVVVTAELPVYFALGNGSGSIHYLLNYNMSQESFTFPIDQSYQIYFNNNQSVVVIVHITCTGDTPVSSADVPGPTLPGGFVLRMITCDTPVYNMAGGTPVATGETIKSGQTWFVNPKSVSAGSASWTEIFVGGWIDGFIPSACIGGKPANYGGL